MRNRFVVPILVYLVALAISLTYAFNHNYLVVSDAGEEYKIYLEIISTGKWIPDVLTLTSANIMTTLVPAMLQRIIGINPELFLKLYHCILLSLLPTLVYLLTTKFIKPKFTCSSFDYLFISICSKYNLFNI